ncbi:Fibroblast growth factor receptor 2 [Geodia barretti]|nr:Fibroblast growth factor receptor 2 [Geodia barretti]
MIYSTHQLRLSTALGHGVTGQVYKAYIKASELVAVKTANALFLTSDFETLAKEVSTVLSFKHVNVLSLIGVCIDGETPLLIMPFMSNGSVLDYVRNHRNKLLIDQFEEKTQMACKTHLRISLQVAKGMEYISNHGFLHCNLRARNCMIDAEGVVKVADYGLTQSTNYYHQRKAGVKQEPIRWMTPETIENRIYAEATNVSTNYCHQRKDGVEQEKKLPIRWMAPETIENHLYTEATDVWSYGVTMWEIFTSGRVPYAEIHAMGGLLCQLKGGYRLERPENKACNDDIYDIMLSCWEKEATERPKFSDLVDTVNDQMERDSGHLELSLAPTGQIASPPPSPRAEVELKELHVLGPHMHDVTGAVQGSCSTEENTTAC